MVRIALISDIHCGKLSRSTEFSVPGIPIQDETRESASLTGGFVSILKENDVQYIFIAGDLTSEGSPQEFYYCEQKILAISQDAGIPRENIFLGMGNHDIDWKITNLCDAFAEEAGEGFPAEVVRNGYQLIAATAPLCNINHLPKPTDGPVPFSGTFLNEKFIVFVLNSGWCCTRDQKIKHGKLDTSQLEWFKKSAEEFQDDDRWKIVLIHHHPHSYSFPTPFHDTSILEEGSRLIDISGENGIHLILHGHRHHPKAETQSKSGWRCPVTFVCSGSLSVNAAHRSCGEIPNTFHILELSKTPGVLKLLNFQYTSSTGWIPLRRKPEAPLDYKMMLGRIVDNPDEIAAAIGKLGAIQDGITMNDLDDCLHFIPLQKLNEEVKKFFSATHIVYGRFPEEVYLVLKTR